MKIIDYIKLAAAQIGAIIGAFIGSVSGMIWALLIFAVIDYITGVTAAILEHKLSSEIGFRGITRKVLLFLIVGVANVLDVYVIGSGGVCRSMVLVFYIANEGLSIIENVARCGVPVPEKLKIILKQLEEEDHAKR